MKGRGKAQPSALILAGHGLNCERETLLAVETAGGRGRILHVDDLIAAPRKLDEHQLLILPGGFSFGDHTGAGKALANRLTAGLGEAMARFFSQDRLGLGICNGCQALVKSRLWTDQQAVAAATSLAANAGGHYICRWEALEVADSNSPWLTGLSALELPIAHGEGRFLFPADARVGLRYVADPNGSQDRAAALLGHQGRVLVMMPHPERAIRFTSLPDWTRQRERLQRAGQPLPQQGPGLALFQNALAYFG